uniref:Uncharacterized protein n=1 Tax=Anguilla anguilla TaxID=7936 RepID=A0A0E9XSC9_ANGAN
MNSLSKVKLGLQSVIEAPFTR